MNMHSRVALYVLFTQLRYGHFTSRIPRRHFNSLRTVSNLVLDFHSAVRDIANGCFFVSSFPHLNFSFFVLSQQHNHRFHFFHSPYRSNEKEIMWSSTNSKKWVPDADSEFCNKCNGEFGILNRKHHCRLCGHLLCATCCDIHMLIPKDRLVSPPGQVDDHTVPRRVCMSCAQELRDLQEQLIASVSKSNTTLHFEKDSMETHFNTPVSLKLQTDIRKAAYTLYNFIKEDREDNVTGDLGKVPRQLIEGCKGIVFITILKVGMIFTGRVGTGLIVARLGEFSN